MFKSILKSFAIVSLFALAACSKSEEKPGIDGYWLVESATAPMKLAKGQVMVIHINASQYRVMDSAKGKTFGTGQAFTLKDNVASFADQSMGEMTIVELTASNLVVRNEQTKLEIRMRRVNEGYGSGSAGGEEGGQFSVVGAWFVYDYLDGYNILDAMEITETSIYSYLGFEGFEAGEYKYTRKSENEFGVEVLGTINIYEEDANTIWIETANSYYKLVRFE